MRQTTSCRQKIYLVDVEHAKKEEFERRKKLRLQQVRQQAREIASLIRNRSNDARKKQEDRNKQVQAETAVRSSNSLKKDLQQKLSECLTSVGAAHSSAAVLSEVDELVQDKAALQDSLARVRAALANEKAKDTQIPRQEVVKNVREGISISKVSKIQPTVQSYRHQEDLAGSQNDGRSGKSRFDVPATPPDLVGPCSGGKLHGTSVDGKSNAARAATAQRAIFSAPMVPPSRPKSAWPISKTRIAAESKSGRRSCPPRTDSLEGSFSSSDSDDSGQTWPPASVRRKTSKRKVRMYDHTAKKCSEYVQQTGIVRAEMDDLPNDMPELIRDEEALHARKAEEISEQRQIELERGLRALREEVAKKDFDDAIKDLCHFSKESRYRKANDYANKTRTGLPCQPQENVPSPKQTDLQEPQKRSPINKGTVQEKEKSSDHRPPVDVTNEPVSALVSKLIKQREELLRDSINEETSSTYSEDDTADGQSSLPWWLKSQLEAEMGTAPEIDASGRPPTPETVVGRYEAEKERRHNQQNSENNGGIQVSSNRDVAEGCPEINSSTPGSASETVSQTSAALETPRRPVRKRVEFQSNSCSSSDHSKNSSGSSAGINVCIKISREQSSTERLPTRQPLSGEQDSSTSYFSPPEKLSPAQLSVLSDILSKMSVRNDNPVLRHYIMRLLDMSRRSLSDLEVSSCSDLTVQSDIFSQQSTLKRSSRQNKDTVDCRHDKDNFSTAGTVSSVPPTPSSIQSMGPGQFAQIAGLLRNIFELQRIYNSHSSSQSSELLSDSRSSYRDLPERVGSLKCHPSAAPAGGNGLNYNDDTGLFDDHYTAAQQLLASLMKSQNFKIDVPPNLLPRPFEDSSTAGSQDAPAVPASCNRMVNSAEKTAAPGTCRLPEEQNSQVLSLSDIESVISSVQSTPTKNMPTGRISSSAQPLQRLPQDISTISELLSGELISSREMCDNSLIETLSSSSSTSDIEEVFRSLGLTWALSTLRRMKNSRRLRGNSSSKSGQTSSAVDEGPRSSTKSSSSSSPSYHHSTPNKETRETPRRSPDDNLVPSLTPPDVALQCPSWKK